MLFVQSIAAPAAAKVVRDEIYPIKVPEVIDAPPPWMAKISGKSPEERKRFAVHE